VDQREESKDERADRQLVELLQELRVVQTGVQVLFAFLLSVPFTNRFGRLNGNERALYFVTLLLAGFSVVLLLAPTAWHRVLFRLGDKPFLVLVGHRLAIGGLACVGVSVVGVVMLVASVLYGSGWAVATGAVTGAGVLTLWVAMPFARRRADRRARAAGRAPS